MGGMKLSRNVLNGLDVERLGRTELLSLHKTLTRKDSLNSDQVTLMSHVQHALQVLDKDHQSVLAYRRHRL